jgi:hypothetical protein
MTSLLTRHLSLKGPPFQTGYNWQPSMWEVSYGDRNSLEHPLWECGFSWIKSLLLRETFHGNEQLWWDSAMQDTVRH